MDTHHNQEKMMSNYCNKQCLSFTHFICLQSKLCFAVHLTLNSSWKNTKGKGKLNTTLFKPSLNAQLCVLASKVHQMYCIHLSSQIIIQRLSFKQVNSIRFDLNKSQRKVTVVPKSVIIMMHYFSWNVMEKPEICMELTSGALNLVIVDVTNTEREQETFSQIIIMWLVV